MQYGRPWCNDGIAVNNLQLQSSPHNGLDAWGREKEQPVLLSVRLSFKSSFDSAAEQDALDSSTVHYGILSKTLRATKPEESWGSLSGLGETVHKTITAMLPGPDLLESLAIQVKLPKASLLGEAVILNRQHTNESVCNTLHLVDICLPTLIGVNANEREAKQKLIINVWINGLSDKDCDSYTQLEATLTQIIDLTGYETLESLVLHIVRNLYKNYVPLQQSGTSIRISLAKPQAVPFADAPAIEIYRTSEQLYAASRS
ncbi:hypothetical protein AAFC00_006455 [Neodothiora populina]|uniref:dihydroneopterin aldolase n=1 Tax=Neodothiora populina TaxID=2781224 RepID=A0ABR3P584_9PEZI